MSRTIARGALLCTLFLAGFLVSTAFAQSNARLWGIVTDSSGAVVAGADLSVRNQATGVEYTAKTNDSGIYQLAALPAPIGWSCELLECRPRRLTILCWR